MTLWSDFANFALTDSNQDGFTDGVLATLLPMESDSFTPEIWREAANLAFRLGLETPAASLPFARPVEQLEAWQRPIFLRIGDGPTPPGWRVTSRAGDSQIVQNEQNQVGLLLSAQDAAGLAVLLRQIAFDGIVAKERQTDSAAQTERTLDLAHLFESGTHGLLRAGEDGYTPVDAQASLHFGPETTTDEGMAGVNLALRLGLESTGGTLPIAFAADALPEEGSLVLALGLRKDAGNETGNVIAEHDGTLSLSAETAGYLAQHYPNLSPDTKDEEIAEQDTLQQVVNVLEEGLMLRTPESWLALADAQAGAVLTGENGVPLSARQELFQVSWRPDDGLDHAARIQALLAQPPAEGTPRGRLQVFCSGPKPVRQTLAQSLSEQYPALTVSVLPVHKAGLAWLLEEQIPQLGDKEIAEIELAFAPFEQPDAGADSDTPWLDLPHRWLQEIFPGDEVLAKALGLDPEQVRMEPMTATRPPQSGMDPIYRLTAFDANGQNVHEAELTLLWDERLYLPDMPEQGVVHPSSGGALYFADEEVGSSEGSFNTVIVPVPTDEALFWDFYQSEVLPKLKAQMMAVGQGQPSPDDEPYFESLIVDGYFGWPDEPVGVYEEFVSVGEALHEDIYFNTLDYAAAVGEAASGRPINAPGQVKPLIHHYYGPDDDPVEPENRATVTLTDWQVPLQKDGRTLGRRQDGPLPESVVLSGMAVGAGGVEAVTVTATYADEASAELAARVLSRWQARRQGQSGPGLPVPAEVICRSGDARHVVSFQPWADSITIDQPTQMQTDVIDMGNLREKLVGLGQLSGVQPWFLGRSYQGRAGYGLDVILPVESHQTHLSRIKLSAQKPTHMIVARHHANEVSSTTAALDLARDLATDPALRPLLERVNVTMLPIANPDGTAFHSQLMAEHPRWKHHAARFNGAGKEFGADLFNPHTLFGEARFRMALWRRWLPDGIVDNHGVPSHEWCQPFAGYNTPPRFRVSYQVVQAMLYGIISYLESDEWPALKQAAHAVRTAVSEAVAREDWLHERNQYWLRHYQRYNHRWVPEKAPMDVHNGMIFFFRSIDPADSWAKRNFAAKFPQITLFDWVTEVPDETAQGDYLRQCAQAHRVANMAVLERMAEVGERGELSETGGRLVWQRQRRMTRRGE